MNTDITTREDIYNLVKTFYTRLRRDVYLGPIFERHIKNWPEHFDHLTDFWSNSLFHTGTYNGNPLKIHEKVDIMEARGINEQHFGVWLNYWVQSIDDLFEGDNASILKMKARKMATHIHVHLFQARSHNTNT